MSSQENEIFLGAGNNMTMKASKLVSTYQTLYLTTPTDGTIVLNVKIEADFDTIPQEYQEVFMNMLSVKYLVTAYDGQIWPSRLIGFGIGVIVFGLMSHWLFKEPFTTLPLSSNTLIFGCWYFGLPDFSPLIYSPLPLTSGKSIILFLMVLIYKT